MIILGIETSCDETAAAVLTKEGNRIQILSNVVASSAVLQAKYGGIIPEQAAREQIKSIIPVIEEALIQANLTRHSELVSESQRSRNKFGMTNTPPIDAIAVTHGPGLIGSLLVGVETAKTLALIWKKPLIPVNHLLGHFYANWITRDVIPANAGIQLEKYSSELDPRSSSLSLRAEGLRGDDEKGIPHFSYIGLLVSGGHTDLVLFKDHGKYQYLGGTRDDAAGECFDKCARLLGLPYPGGPQISKLAQYGNPQAFNLPRPMIDSKDFDFSFSGLKTAVSNLIKDGGRLTPNAESSRVAAGDRTRGDEPQGVNTEGVVSEQESGSANQSIHDLAASIEQAIVDVLVDKTIKAAKVHGVKNIMIAGGVAANQKLVDSLQVTVDRLQLNIKLHIPPSNLCTDNGAMIASAAFFQKPIKNALSLQADPSLSLQFDKHIF